MANKTLNESEKNNIKELIMIAQSLSETDQQHLLWIGQGIMFASKATNGKAS